MKNNLFLPHIKTELKDDVHHVQHNDAGLNLFLSQYYNFSKKERAQIKYDYKNAPFKFPTEQKFEWLWRQETLKIVERVIDNKSQLNILEVSPWNYWLTHHISKNNNVICADYFDDEHEGLKSRKHFQNSNWTSVCCDLENINIFETKFDLIIVNHSLQFFQNHEKLISSLKSMLSEKGQILLVGLNVYKDFSEKQKQTQELQAHYKTNGFNSSVRMGKGFLNVSDIEFIEKEGFEKYPYNSLMFKIRNILSQIRNNKPLYCYMLWNK